MVARRAGLRAESLGHCWVDYWDYWLAVQLVAYLVYWMAASLAANLVVSLVPWMVVWKERKMVGW